MFTRLIIEIRTQEVATIIIGYRIESDHIAAIFIFSLKMFVDVIIAKMLKISVGTICTAMCLHAIHFRKQVDSRFSRKIYYTIGVRTHLPYP
jgi:hypothetical protein